MSISLRLSEEDDRLFRQYAALHGISVSELVRQSVLTRIEDETDLTAYAKAMVAYQKDPVTYSLDEAEKELGLQ